MFLHQGRHYKWLSFASNLKTEVRFKILSKNGFIRDIYLTPNDNYLSSSKNYQKILPLSTMAIGCSLKMQNGDRYHRDCHI